MVFNANVNNNSVLSWRSVLLVEETGIPGENHRPAASHWQTLSPMLYRVHLTGAGFQLTTLVVIGTDCMHHDHDRQHKNENNIGLYFIITTIVNIGHA